MAVKVYIKRLKPATRREIKRTVSKPNKRGKA